MTEDRVEGLLRVQRSIAETLELYGRLFDQQPEQLQKLQEGNQTIKQKNN